MSFYEDEPQHPRAQDIQLTQENEVLRTEFLKGVERAITSDFAHTFEVTDTSDRSGWLALPGPKYLSRAVIMKLDGLSSELADGNEGNEVLPPLFNVVIEVSGHQLDKDRATDITPQEAEDLDFVWPDGLKITLIDHTYSNVSAWSYCWQPAMRPAEFDFTGYKTGFEVNIEDTPKTPVLAAMGIKIGGLDGLGITEDGFDRLTDFRIINQILQSGSPDLEGTRKLVEILQTSESAELLTIEPRVIRNSMPYFKRLIATAIDTPKFRDMLAWRQYWDQKTA